MSVDRQATIARVGEQIFERMSAEQPSIFRKDFWMGQLMTWAMRDEGFKLQLFRFVDVYPSLRTPEQVGQHIQTFFLDAGIDLPPWMVAGAKVAAGGGWLGRAAASQLDTNLRAMATQFVAAADESAALPLVAERRKANMGFTVDLLGEATLTETEAETMAARYHRLIDALGAEARTWQHSALLDRDSLGDLHRANVSVKISALSAQIIDTDPEGSIARIKRRLLPLMEHAHAKQVFVNLDMEHHALKDLTLALFRSLMEEPSLRDVDQAGFVLQAYLRSVDQDCQDMIQWIQRRGRPYTIRLVKGAYWDAETVLAAQRGWPSPVWDHKAESDAAFERSARRLAASHQHLRLAGASHNVRSLAALVVDAAQAGAPANWLEAQMLYGMAEPLKRACVGLGLRVREYLPVGPPLPGMAYLVRRLLENTSNEGFLRQRFVDGRETMALLADPSAQPTAATARHGPARDLGPFRNTPTLDFADRDPRRALAEALQKLRPTLPLRVPVVLDGVEHETSAWLPSLNPADPGEVIALGACAEAGHVDRAVVGAARSFPAWRRRPVGERAAYARRLADMLERDRAQHAALIVLEVAKSWAEADADVAEAIDFCRYYADRAEELQGAPLRLGGYPGELDLLFHRPLGVCAVIAPWNFPLAILCGMSVAALVTGNTVVMKPAEASVGVAWGLARAMQAAGFPADVVQFLPGRGEVAGAALAAHPDVRMIAFTGSAEVGQGLLSVAASDGGLWGPKRVVCEMGGKNAIVIDDDADLDEAIAGVVHAAFGYQGQKCSACSRVIALESVADECVERLAGAIASLRIGPPEGGRYVHGPLIDVENAARIRRAHVRAAGEARQVVLHLPEAEGEAYAPFGLYDRADARSFLGQDELFGPVLALFRARDLEEAFALASGTRFALTGALYSRDPRHLAMAQERFEVGNLYLNRPCTGALVHRMPFGGFKCSGLGTKAGGPYSLRSYVIEQATSELTLRRGFSPETVEVGPRRGA